MPGDPEFRPSFPGVAPIEGAAEAHGFASASPGHTVVDPMPAQMLGPVAPFQPMVPYAAGPVPAATRAAPAKNRVALLVGVGAIVVAVIGSISFIVLRRNAASSDDTPVEIDLPKQKKSKAKPKETAVAAPTPTPAIEEPDPMADPPEEPTAGAVPPAPSPAPTPPPAPKPTAVTPPKPQPTSAPARPPAGGNTAAPSPKPTSTGIRKIPRLRP